MKQEQNRCGTCRWWEQIMGNFGVCNNKDSGWAETGRVASCHHHEPKPEPREGAE